MCCVLEGDAGRFKVSVHSSRDTAQFVVGAGSQELFDGSYFAAKTGVIVVTMNYRLGILGFLALEPKQSVWAL